MLKPIKSNDQLEDYLARAYDLMQKDIEPNTTESDELEVLSILIEDYESKQFPIEPQNPIDAILFRLDQEGLTRSDLQHLLGSRSRTSNYFFCL